MSLFIFIHSSVTTEINHTRVFVIVKKSLFVIVKEHIAGKKNLNL